MTREDWVWIAGVSGIAGVMIFGFLWLGWPILRAFYIHLG